MQEINSINRVRKEARMASRRFNELVFQHMIDLPNCDCVFCSTKEQSTGKTRLYLVFNERRRIYVRNGVKDTWDELKDEQEYDHIRTRFNNAILRREIPCFSAGSDDFTISDFKSAF